MAQYMVHGKVQHMVHGTVHRTVHGTQYMVLYSTWYVVQHLGTWDSTSYKVHGTVLGRCVLAAFWR